MDLLDILAKEEWLALETELHERFGMNCTVYNADGLSFTGQPNFCNPLCPAIKKNPDSLAAICAPGNQNFMSRAKASGKPVVDECDAGMVKIAVPIFVDGEFMGTAGGCGRLYPEGEVETFLIQKTSGMSEDEIAGLAAEVDRMTPEEALAMADFLVDRLAEILKK